MHGYNVGYHCTNLTSLLDQARQATRNMAVWGWECPVSHDPLIFQRLMLKPTASIDSHLVSAHRNALNLGALPNRAFEFVSALQLHKLDPVQVDCGLCP